MSIDSEATFTTLAQVLLNIDGLNERAWLYLPGDASWSLVSRAAVLQSGEVAPESEEEPGAGVPEAARRAGLVQALPITVVGEIVANARAQVPDADDAALLSAFLYYYDNDAFTELP